MFTERCSNVIFLTLNRFEQVGNNYYQLIYMLKMFFSAGKDLLIVSKINLEQNSMNLAVALFS